MADGPPTWVAILDDRGLSREARLMAMHLCRLGPGEHEVSTEDWQRVLGRTASSRGYPKRHTIATHTKELELAGWVTRKDGGIGSPRYSLQSPPGTVEQSGYRTGPVPQPATVPGGDGRGGPAGDGRIPLVAPPGTVDVRVVVEEEEVGEEEDAREVGGYSLVPSVESIVDQPGDDGRPLLEGCRGALLDYLRARVMGPGQIGYVRSLQAWLRGGSGTPRGLLDVDDPPHLLATALNDLLTEDERKYKSGRGQVGVIANLRTKVEVLATAEMRPAKATGTDGPIHRSRQRREVRVGE